MLTSLLILVATILGLFIHVNNKESEISDLKREIRTLNNEMELSIQNERKRVLKRAYKQARAHYDSLPTKTEIIYKYETKTQIIRDTVLLLPDSAKFEFIRAELERLYR
jgi:predicted Holliday junction resolvase-like endonuclease